MKHAWTNEWNNSFVDNVSGGVQSPGRGGGETQGGTQRTAALLSSLLHQFFQHMGGQFLAYGYIILKVKSLSFSYSE